MIALCVAGWGEALRFSRIDSSVCVRVFEMGSAGWIPVVKNHVHGSLAAHHSQPSIALDAARASFALHCIAPLVDVQKTIRVFVFCFFFVSLGDSWWFNCALEPARLIPL